MNCGFIEFYLRQKFVKHKFDLVGQQACAGAPAPPAYSTGLRSFALRALKGNQGSDALLSVRKFTEAGRGHRILPNFGTSRVVLNGHREKEH